MNDDAGSGAQQVTRDRAANPFLAAGAGDEGVAAGQIHEKTLLRWSQRARRR
jgi:hypothetical protein